MLSAEAGGGRRPTASPPGGRRRTRAQLLAAARRHHGSRPRAAAPPDRLGRVRRRARRSWPATRCSPRRSRCCWRPGRPAARLPVPARRGPAADQRAVRGPRARGPARTSTLDEVLRMEAGKTAALLACSSSIGAVAAGAAPRGRRRPGGVRPRARAWPSSCRRHPRHRRRPGVTGKSSSSDVRAGKRSAPDRRRADGRHRRRATSSPTLLDGGPPRTDDDVAPRRRS